MSDKFYNWLARKYGWGELTFSTLDEDFQETLVREYCSIAASYGTLGELNIGRKEEQHAQRNYDR